MKPNPELWVYIRPAIDLKPLDTNEYDLEFYTVKNKAQQIHQHSKIALTLLKQQGKLNTEVNSYICYIPREDEIKIIGEGRLTSEIDIPKDFNIPFKKHDHQ